MVGGQLARSERNPSRRRIHAIVGVFRIALVGARRVAVLDATGVAVDGADRRVAVDGAGRRHGGLGRRSAGRVRAHPHCFGHPVKVRAVDEDARTTASVELRRLTSFVEQERHQRHANHTLRVEVVAHLRILACTDVHRVGEAVVDVLNLQFLDGRLDDRLDLRRDVLAHLVPNLLSREIGPVEDLDCERVEADDLVTLDGIDAGEAQNVIPVETSLSSSCVDAVDVPLLVTNSFHQAGPGERLCREAQAAIQERSGVGVGGRVEHHGGSRVASVKRQRRDGTVEVFDTDLIGAIQ